MVSSKSVKLPAPDAIREAMLGLLNAKGARASIGPSDVARALMGNDEKVWRFGMRPVGQAAVAMAIEGVIVITRRGKPVPPSEVRGIYRIRLRAEGETVEYPVKPETGIDGSDPGFDGEDFDFGDDDED